MTYEKARLGLLILSGAMPVGAIPLYVLGWISMTHAALFCVIPLTLVATAIMIQRSPEGVWAIRGVVAGLLAVLAYDCVRMPLVWADIWPDFIPRLGGAITGESGSDAFVGYIWRYLGDGAGIGLSYFVFCGMVLAIRPGLIAARPVIVSIGYAIFIWTGLLATVVLPARGQELLFRLTPASFALSLLGHLIYGTVLGLYLRRHVAFRSARRPAPARRAAVRALTVLVLGTVVLGVTGASSTPAAASGSGVVVPPRATFTVNWDSGFNAHAPARHAFQAAVNVWKGLIRSRVPILIDAHWRAAASTKTLGSAIPVAYKHDFAGAAVRHTLYPIALANSLSGKDLAPDQPDIAASFNSAYGGWYFGVDGKPGVTQTDFMTVVLHELGHGLGFLGTMRVQTDATKTVVGGYGLGSGLPSIYDRFVASDGKPITSYPNNSAAMAAAVAGVTLTFTGRAATAADAGSAPTLYSPSPWAADASYSHLDEATYPTGTPNALMTARLAADEALHSPGRIVLGMLTDMGWNAAVPTVSIGDARVVEGDTSHPTAWFTVSLSAATTVPVTVTYATAAGTATADSDFITAAGTAVVPAGSLGAQVSVVINGDTVIEPNENFTVALSAPVRATLGRARGMGTILTDDPATGLRVDVGDASIVEGQTGFLALRLTVSLSTLSLEPVSVDWSTTSVTAAAGIDYAATAGTLTIPAGESSGWIDVAVRADRFPEPNKTFNVMLANATGGAAELGRATGVGTILDDDDGAAAGRISGGAGHTCMVRAGGTVRCWGSNSFHELGDGTTSYRTSPVTVAGLTGIVSVSAGGYLTCVLRGNGTVGCWGRNDVGELGDGTFVERSAPLSVSGLTHAVAVSAGGSSACAVRRDGTVSCWGDNFYGELGDGTFTNRSTPVPVAGLTGVVTVSSGGGHVCALLNDGTVECWGWNAYGQLGDDTHVNRSRPVAVSGLTGAVSISTGTQHSCALLGDGKVRCWGSNLWGQLGDGTSVDRSTPVTVAGVTSGVSVHTGWAHTCTVLRDTTMRCWGYDQSGELGDGRTVLTGGPAPVTVSGLSGVVAASAGGYHTCVIRGDTSVECWGWNAFGQLGDGTGRDRATPVRVVGW